ncbi:uncharacterized protein [Spinacia oleracea]|uniref:Retrotransposon Copia-like N-terminal domain-containing protein n=1 Tax=Spinacia oleracea TaxID=3562 RepID=A0A9R0IJF2_SPIOL|nr:uncharacterized protein LOC110790018 [Spinacia oleracea]
MAGEDDVVSPPHTTMVHAYHPALNATNVKALIPLVLDVDNVQYTPWATLFRNTAKVYMVLDHIDPNVKKPKDMDDDLWERLDAIVLQWLYGTISKELLLKVLDDKASALDIWNRLKKIFRDNRGTRVVLLENQFGAIKMSNYPSLEEYCQALKTVADQLAALDHPVSEERLVLQLVGKLDADYRTIGTIIRQTNPLPSFDEACSTLDLDRLGRLTEKEDDGASTALLVSGNTQHNSASVPQPPSTNGGGSGGRAGSGKTGGGKNYKGKKHNSRGSGSGSSGSNSGGQARGSQQQQTQQPVFMNPWANFWAQQFMCPPCPYPSQPWRNNANPQ